MSPNAHDAMWDAFAPLWQDIITVSPGAVLAGGYGLFLKQTWLQNGSPEIAIVVPLAHWRTPPRVTRDLDIIVEIEVIGSPVAQAGLHGILERHGYNPVPGNERWQFFKEVEPGISLKVDFHAPVPDPLPAGVIHRGRRLKAKPSLNDIGIHGRENPEAVGCSHCPFIFSYRGLNVAIPNPVSFATMKVTAANDQRARWLAETDNGRERDFYQGQAQKHAGDACRVAAMLTREESDSAQKVLELIHDEPPYIQSADLFARSFAPNEGWADLLCRQNWEDSDYEQIRLALGRLFPV